MKKITKNKLRKITQFITNPRLLFCIGIAWLITNGWSYILFGIGSYFGIGWMVAVSSAYMAFLWLPFSPEKIATAAIAIALLRLLFPKDDKTLSVLSESLQNAKRSFKRKFRKKDDPTQ
ncbi:MAG: hypothetical protein IJY04_03010 [Clostridia bacterium]|nr:hypothetical protein [Clostridia bacterium]